MVIHIQLCHGTDENFEFLFRGDFRCEHIVQTMDAFQHQNLAFFRLNLVAIVFPLACNKVISRQVYQFPCNHFLQIVVEQRQVKSLNMFIIPFAVFIHRCFIPFHKVIIQRDFMRLDAQYL